MDLAIFMCPNFSATVIRFVYESYKHSWQNLSRICKKAEDGIKQSQMQSFQSNQSPNSKFDGELNVIIHWWLKYLKLWKC